MDQDTDTQPFDDLTGRFEALATQAEAVDDEADPMAMAAGPGPEPEPETQGLDHDDALVTAELFVEVAEQTVCDLWPYLEYDDKTRQRVAQRLAAVMAKRGGEMPPWLLAYREELQLAGVMALVVVKTRAQIRAHERALIEQEDSQRREHREPVTAAPEPDAGQDDAAFLADMEVAGNA